MKVKNMRMALDKNKLVALKGIKNASLLCEKGKLWITGTKEGDLVINCGEKVNLFPLHSLIIQGGTDSMFSMEIN